MGSWQEELERRRSDEAVAASIPFEAVKSHFRQSKEGVTISFILNPIECPQEIVTAPIGQRYICALVPIGDDEKPVMSDERRQIEADIQSCGMMCRDIEFQHWMVGEGLSSDPSEGACADGVRRACGISSRTEFRSNPRALRKWRALRQAFVSGEKT